jgi:hypothetical protein
MNDLIGKLQDLNRIDKEFNYTIQILSTGEFILHGLSRSDEKHIRCCDSQCLREKMYDIILKQ